MNNSWLSILFGGGTWPWWYGVLFALFLALMGTAYYVCLDSSGPSGAPFLMFMLHSMLLYVGNLWMLRVLRVKQRSRASFQ